MNKFYFLVLLGTGLLSHAHASCADGAVICKWADNKKAPDATHPAHRVGFGCQGKSILGAHIGPCEPMPDHLAAAQKICNDQYGGVAGQTGCNVDWGSVAQTAKQDFNTVKDVVQNVAKQVGKTALEAGETIAEGAETAGAFVAANPEVLAVAL